MPTKPQKSWTEIELAITAVTVVATLGFWNQFSTPDLSKVTQNTTTDNLPQPSVTVVSQPVPTALALRQVKIIYGGQAPAQMVSQVSPAVVQPSAPVSVVRVAAPVKAASTGSSKP